MQGDKKVLDYLNSLLKAELTSINQYYLHFRMLENWGVKRLAKAERAESIEEMHHADRMMERILFLDGLPNLQALGRLRVGETIEEILQADLDLEMEARPLFQEAIAYCETVRDYASRELLESILEEEEHHIDFLETQQQMIRDQGLPNYIQLQSSDD